MVTKTEGEQLEIGIDHTSEEQSNDQTEDTEARAQEGREKDKQTAERLAQSLLERMRDGDEFDPGAVGITSRQWLLAHFASRGALSSGLAEPEMLTLIPDAYAAPVKKPQSREDIIRALGELPNKVTTVEDSPIEPPYVDKMQLMLGEIEGANRVAPMTFWDDAPPAWFMESHRIPAGSY